METLPTTLRDVLLCDARIVDEAMRAGLSRGRHTSTSTYWDIFITFRQQFGLGPHFSPLAENLRSASTRRSACTPRPPCPT
jgi:hypothetical protein